MAVYRSNRMPGFSLGNLDQDFETFYKLHKPGNGVYAFVIEGKVTINGQALHKRDGLGITDTDNLQIKADSKAELLLMEIPMKVEN
jgi:quercetin 2,3-dioxygenase